MDGKFAGHLTIAGHPTIGAAGRAAAGILLGVAAPFAVTLLIAVAGARFDFSFLFVYVPVILFIAYVNGLFSGVLAAITSTLLALYFGVEPPGLTASKLGLQGLPASLFLLTGTLMAFAGDQYRRYQQELKAELTTSRRRARHEALMGRAAYALASQARFAEAGEVICRECAGVLGDWCALVVVEPMAGVFRLDGFAAGAENEHDAQRRALAAALGRDHETLIRDLHHRTGHAVLSPSGDHTGPEQRWLDLLNSQGLVLAPLRIGDESLGGLLVGSKTPRTWGEEETRVIQLVADRAALVFDGHRQIEQRARRDRDARLLAGIMTEFYQDQPLSELLDRAARHSTETLGDWCGIFLFNADSPLMSTGALHHKEPGAGARLTALLEKTSFTAEDWLAAGVLSARKPLAVTQGDPHARQLIPKIPALERIFEDLAVAGVLAVPVYVGNEALGVLTVGSQTRRHWDQDDLRLASAIADRTGGAIQVIRLLDAERRARATAERDARRLGAVNRIIAIAAKSLDVGAVFDQFAEALQLLLPFVRLSVSLYDPERDWLTTPYFKGPEVTVPPARLEGPKHGTARGRVHDDGRPFVRNDTTLADEYLEDRLLAGAGIRSYAVVPMSVGGRVIGTLEFGHHEPGFYSEKHTEVVQPIADHLAITVAHSRLFDEVQRRAGELAHALQQALLPADLPHVPFTAMAAHYRAADPEARIGGDWYDAMLLPDDCILLSIGDVTGRGLPAAVGMGQVRDVVRAYAIEERRPGEILTAVNTYVCKGPAAQVLSVWVGILDPLSGELRYSSAGHPPVRVLRDDGLAMLDGGGPPLGTSPTTQYRESQAALAPGNRFIAYTDGLIEATRDVLEGEERLARAVLATADRPPDRAVGALVDQVLQGMQPRDDIALLLLDLLPTTTPLVMSLSPLPENLRRVRRAVRAFAERHGMVGAQAEAVVIAVGEAVLNVVEHAYAGRPGKLSVHGEVHGDTLRVVVRDFGRWRQTVERGRGRGTRIMQAFAESMRTRTGPEGTQVELSWSTRPAAGTSG